MRFLTDPDMQFATDNALGSCAYQAAEAGEVLAIVDRITSDDPESWYRAWYAVADGVRDAAEAAHRTSHLVSAAQAYLRAAGYYAASLRMIDATPDPSRMMPTWRRHRACWDRFTELRGFARVQIPYQDTTLPGYFFPAEPAGGDRRRRPLVILTNGSDGPTSAMWVLGAAGAISRGYHALVYDGPGQQAALFEQFLSFRPDWEDVITAVLGYARGRPDVDPERVALLGVGQGGYWVPRALAFEHRIAAGVVDPGVYDVSSLWLDPLPPFLLDLLDHEKRAEFDEAIRTGITRDPRQAARMASRMRPYGMSSPYEVFRAVRGYTMDGIADRITCPMLVLDPDNEQFWPGQSQRLYESLRCSRTLQRFSADEGADGHCQPRSPLLRDQRVFDWLDVTLDHHPG